MPDELRVAATIDNVRLISAFVRGVAERLRLSQDALFDIDVAVEEACTNIVRHAYGSGRSGEILAQVEATDSEMRIRLTDWGRPFEAEAAHLALDVPLDVRAKGGMGVLLIHELMDGVTRTTASAPGGPNVLTLIKHRGR